MTLTRENMFEPSGCLTREAFEALVSYQLPVDAKVLADEHIASCPFCSDSLEGFTSQSQDFAVLMDKADSGFAAVVSKTQSKSKSRRVLLISLSAAASILMLVGLFMLTNNSQPKLQVSQEVKKEEISKKEEVDKKVIAENAEKQKPASSETKVVSPEPAKNAVRSASSEVVGSEDKLKANEAIAPENKAVAPAPVAGEQTPILAEEVSKDEKPKELKKALRKENNGYFFNKSDENSDKTELKSKKVAESSMTYKSTKEETEQPIMYAEQMPQFPGGTDAMLKFIKDNLVYPKSASEMGVSGKVILQFEIDKKGNIENIKVIRGIGGGCDEEAIRVVKLMPKWIPGHQNGKEVPVYFTLPIQFALQK